MDRLEKSRGVILFDPPRRSHESYRRRLWLHPEVDSWAHQIGASSAERRYFADVRALLKRFVVGDDFDDDAVLKPLNGGRDGQWEIRITFTPQDRVFGGFLRPGEFIATNRLTRDQLDKRGFSPSLERSRAIWKRLFGTLPRLNGLAREDLLEDFEP